MKVRTAQVATFILLCSCLFDVPTNKEAKQEVIKENVQPVASGNEQNQKPPQVTQPVASINEQNQKPPQVTQPVASINEQNQKPPQVTQPVASGNEQNQKPPQVTQPVASGNEQNQKPPQVTQPVASGNEQNQKPPQVTQPVASGNEQNQKPPQVTQPVASDDKQNEKKNAQSFSSNPKKIYADPSVKGFIIGVNTYDNYKNLEFAAKDAQSIYKNFPFYYPEYATLLISPTEEQKSHAKGISIVESNILVKKRITKKEVISHLQSFSKNLDENDIFLMFVSSHGDIVEGKYCIVFSDSKKNDLKTYITVEDIVDIFSLFTCRKIIFIFDLCHSGGIPKKIKEKGSQKVVNVKKFAKNLMDKYPKQKIKGDFVNRSLIFLTSSTDSQYSYESPDFQAGYFTASIILALKNMEKNTIQNHITIGSFYRRINNIFPKIASDLAQQGKSQQPIILSTRSNDFDFQIFHKKIRN